MPIQSRSLLAAVIATIALLIAVESGKADPITVLHGQFANMNSMGPSQGRLYTGTLTDGGIFSGGTSANLILDVSGLSSNPGQVSLLSEGLTAHFGMGSLNANPIDFQFTGPLSLSFGPGQIHLHGNVSLASGPSGGELSAFSAGGVFDMDLNPTLVGVTLTPGGGLLSVGVEFNRRIFADWTITANPDNGGTNVPEPLALPLFGFLCASGYWAVRRRKAAQGTVHG